MFKTNLLKMLSLVLVAALTLGVLAAPLTAQRGPRAGQDRPFLGVTVEPDMAEAVVASVVPGSPADDAGLQAGDVITAIDDTDVTAASIAAAIRDYQAGDTVTLTITRDDEDMTLDVTLGARRQPMSMFGSSSDGSGTTFTYDGDSWTITALNEDSPLYEAGLRAGDTITDIDGARLTPAQLARTLATAADDEIFTLTYQRDGETFSADVTAAALRSAIGFFGMPFGMMPPGMADTFSRGERARLGVAFAVIDTELVTEQDLPVNEGALILEVVAESPADAAGLVTGDIITAVDGDVVDAERTLADRLYAYEPDDTVTLTIVRDGEDMTLDVTLDAATFGGGMGIGPFGPGFENFNGQMPFGMFPFEDFEAFQERFGSQMPFGPNFEDFEGQFPFPFPNMPMNPNAPFGGPQQSAPADEGQPL